MESLPISVLLVMLVVAFVAVLVGLAMMFGRLLTGLFHRDVPPSLDEIDQIIALTEPPRRR